MRIACPRCSAVYEVPAFRLKPGKLVRCARCDGDWLPSSRPDEGGSSQHHGDQPSGGTDSLISGALPELTAMDRLAASPAIASSHTSLIGAWVLSFVLLAGAVTAVIGWRDDVIRAWPPSSRILSSTGNTAPQSVQKLSKKAE